MEPQPPTTPGPLDAPAAPPPAPPAAWVAPPTAAPSPWAAAYVPPGRGPISGPAKVGALVLVLFGLLWTAIGALLLLAGGIARTVLEQVSVEGLGDTRFADIAGGVIAGIGVVVLVIAVVEVLTGFLAWRGSGFARVLGILYGLVFGGLTLLAAAGSSGRAEVAGSGADMVSLVVGLAYLYTAVIFIVRWRSPA